MNKNIDQRKSFIILMACYIGGLILYITLDFYLDDLRYAYSADSAVYIEYARNLIHSNVFPAIQPWDPDFAQQSPQINGTHPPGYSILISAFMLAGVDAEIAAPFISRMATYLLPFLMYLSFKSIASIPTLVIVSVLVWFSPGVLYGHFRALADMPFLLCVILSIGLLVSATNKSAIIISGIIAGLSYSLRNVGLALLLATPLSIFIYGMYKNSSLEAIERLSIWLFGCATIVVPLILFNIATFGSPQPYTMPPSTLSLVDNIKAFIFYQSADMIGGTSIFSGRIFLTDTSITDHITLLLVCLIFLIVTIYYVLKYNASALKMNAGNAQTRLSNNFAILLLCVYSLFGAAIVIVARTKYEWGEFVTTRHTMQYSWAFFLALALIMSKYGLLQKKKVIFCIMFLIIFRTTDLHYYHMFTQKEPAQVLSEDKDAITYIKSLPGKALVFTDTPVIFRVESYKDAFSIKNDIGCNDQLESNLKRLVTIANKHKAWAQTYVAISKTAKLNDCSLDIVDNYKHMIALIKVTKSYYIFSIKM